MVVPIVGASRGKKMQLTISQSLYKVRLIKYNLITLLSVSVELVFECINVYYALLDFNFERVSLQLLELIILYIGTTPI